MYAFNATYECIEMALSRKQVKTSSTGEHWPKQSPRGDAQTKARSPRSAASVAAGETLT